MSSKNSAQSRVDRDLSALSLSMPSSNLETAIMKYSKDNVIKTLSIDFKDEPSEVLLTLLAQTFSRVEVLQVNVKKIDGDKDYFHYEGPLYPFGSCVHLKELIITNLSYSTGSDVFEVLRANPGLEKLSLTGPDSSGIVESYGETYTREVMYDELCAGVPSQLEEIALVVPDLRYLPITVQAPDDVFDLPRSAKHRFGKLESFTLVGCFLNFRYCDFHQYTYQVARYLCSLLPPVVGKDTKGKESGVRIEVKEDDTLEVKEDVTWNPDAWYNYTRHYRAYCGKLVGAMEKVSGRRVIFHYYEDEDDDWHGKYGGAYNENGH